jgi:hypothetical protein
MKDLFASLIAMLLFGCSMTKSSVLKEHIAQQEQECSSANGKLRRVGNYIYACAWPTNDNGRTCSDSSECEGVCELPESAYDISLSTVKHTDGTTSQPVRILRVKIGDNLQGVCSSLRFKGKPTNCTLLIAQGKVTSTECIE